ncbi:NPC intracellular cholesterol transporter 2-like [Ornithodoros turicata]|uniref:NPC intracellular cholesterol transporter 2-like n=1 Tax=Ornithodoros turicata TaxID=34597 RepID=UPI00313A1D46
MYAVRICIFVFCVCYCVVCEPVSFTDCGHGNIRNVTIDTCKKQPCRFKIGTRVPFQATFVAPFPSPMAFNDIHAFIERSKFLLPEPIVDACLHHIRPGCPLRKGQVYTYKFNLLVRHIYPATRATIEYRLTNREGSVIGCARVPVIIVR